MRVFWKLTMQTRRKGVSKILLVFLPLCIAGNATDVLAEATARPLSGPPILVNVSANIARLIAEEDTDGDMRITVRDACPKEGQCADGRFRLVAISGKEYEVIGTRYLSNLLQELKLAHDAGSEVCRIDVGKIFEGPIERLSRSIRELYWDGLTRRIDEAHLEQLLPDEKINTGGFRYLYVPFTDADAYRYYADVARRRPGLRLRVERLPRKVTPQFVKNLDGKHGLLGLALETTADDQYRGVPFVVPGGRFNEMYGWDSYFETLGLLQDDRLDLAKAMVDNFVYQIRHYGKILNANRTYYLTRSQPPFLTSMALAVYQHLPRDSHAEDWLREVFRAAIREYQTVWMADRRMSDIGLNRYYGSGLGIPPEVEEGHFDAIFAPHAKERGLDIRTFENMYKSGDLSVPDLDRFFVHDRCVRESGHDTTYRWSWHGDRCADFVTVDLNSLLYKIERDIARTIEQEFGGALDVPGGEDERSSVWRNRAARRKELINRYLWDEKHGMYLDYDFKKMKRRRFYVSPTTFYPMWAGLASQEQAATLVDGVLPLLEMAGGIAASTENSRGPISASRPARQWDYPNGWAPHQMLIWKALLDYGFDETAHRLIYRWLYTISRNAADYNGTVPEKLDVVDRSHEVFAEYGNVGTRFAYITKEGFGWMNASYQVGLALLPEDLRAQLDRLIPPEWLFDR